MWPEGVRPVDTADNQAPYASPENVERILDRVLKSGLKGKIDTDFLIQLGINETMIPRTLRALEFLGLIENDGTATPTLSQFIVSDEAGSKAILREAVQTAYTMIFRAVNPETDDRTKVFNAFKPMKPQGQRDRMTTLFLGLCRYAGIAVKEPPPNRAAKGEKRERVRKPTQRTNGKTTTPTTTTPLALPPAPPRRLDPLIAELVSKIPDLETREELENWISIFRANFSYVKKIQTE
jgi:hypothetical protein